MKKQIIKSIVAASIMLAMMFGGNAAFANPIYGKNSLKKKAKHPKTVRITVSKKGFSPSSISTEQGSPLTLIFRRPKNEGCGNKVVFPSLNITRDLPVGKNVTIKFTPTDTGNISFTCGMGMYKGSIVVSD
jgi:plastocyanin domain-containing protein